MNRLTPITELAELTPRAKSGAVYPAGATCVQISATDGQVPFLSDAGTVESKYAVIVPFEAESAYYLHAAIRHAMPEFVHRYRQGLNIVGEHLQFLRVRWHQDPDCRRAWDSFLRKFL